MTAALNDCTAVIRGKSSPFKLRAVLLATTFIVPFFIPSGAAQAQVVIEGGTTENVPGTQASPWNIGNTLTVGDSGDGTLNIGVGGVPGVVTDTTVYLGFLSSALGSVTVTGAGSSWSTSENFYVGSDGRGRMVVQDGAQVASATVGGTLVGSYIGYFAGSSGTVFVQGAGSVWTTNTLVVAESDGSQGYLTIMNGGRVNSTDGYIGDQTATLGGGSVFVLGTGTVWDMTGDLTVGNRGRGSLNVEAGATASVALNGYIGRSLGGDGIALVTGAGSILDVGGTLSVGVADASGVLTIADGGVVKVGGGTGTLKIAGSGANGVVSIGGALGQTAVAPGTLQASLVQFGTGGSGILNFNHTDSNYIFAPVIAGSGQIIQEAGHTTLTANSNGFTDAIIVNGGTLSINGSFTGTTGVTVNSGGTLGGTGIITDATINSGGTLAPGNSIGTFTVGGALTFSAGSTYAIEVSPTASDHTHATGEAILGGATVAASFAPGSYINKQYNILNADLGVSGTFGPLVNTNLPPNFVSSLSYDAENVYLNLTAAFAGASKNQQNVADALNGYFNANGSIPAAFGTLNADGFSGVSGEVGAAVVPASFMAMNQFLNAMGDATVGVNVAPGGGAAGAYAPAPKLSPQQASAYAAVTPRDRGAPTFTSRWNVWASGYGSNSRVDGDTTTGSHNTSTRVYGTVVGADYRPGPDTRFGFALGGAGTNFNLDAGLGGGRSDLFQAGGYARHQIGAAYLIGSAAYGWQDVTTDRTVNSTDLAGLPMSASLRGRFQANTFALRGEGGWRVALPFANATPYAALQVTTTRLPGYSESATSGSGQFALAYAAQSTTNVRTELGLRADKSRPMSEGEVILRGRAAWAHDSNANPSATPSFQALPGTSFTVYGAAQSPDALLTTAAVEAKWLNGFSIGATLESEVSKTSSSFAGRGTLRYSW